MKLKTIFFTVCALLILNFSSQAQEAEDNIRMVKPFKADGITNEWNEPLNEFNSETKLAFALANDDQRLYIVIESLDPQTTFNVLRGGITLNINTEGKKKNGINLTFPLMERPPLSNDGAPKEDAEVRNLPKINKGIKVSGFKNIADGELPMENNSGIETGMVIKPNRDLIYELSIPLSQLQVGLDMKKPLMYNIKINAPARPEFKKEHGSDADHRSGGGGMGGGRGRSGGMGKGMGRGMGGGEHGQRSAQNGESADKAADFWIKFKLAKAL